jgi:pyruvate/2-oxoglutarate dehydrogenase complex dihydrolipoamide dehydrogenase (E3) component
MHLKKKGVHMSGEGYSAQPRKIGEDGNASASLETEASSRSSHYDLIVIGSGQCGNPLAAAFHAKGKRVAVIERGAVGGTCVNYGCTPTKTMVASAEVAHMARRAREFGVESGEVTVDMRAVVERKRGIVEASRKSSEKKYQNGIELLRGTGFFTGPKQVRVRLNEGSERDLAADIIVIDTGLSATLPDVSGLDTVPHLDNESIMELERLPQHLLVLGGGYVGLEFAQMFRRFGSEVTIIQHGPQLLAGEDADVAEEIAKLLREDGIKILLDTKVTSASAQGANIRLIVAGICETRTIEGSDLLVATGRKPNTDTLNLPAARIATNEHGFIPVNERLETVVPGVFAVGDVNGGPAFTHISYDDFRILKTNLLDSGDRVTTGRPLPYCLFIDPQLGRIGLNEVAAKKTGRDYKVAKVKMSSVARAFETGQTRGFMKALVDPDTKEILGAAILGADGGELMSMIEIAMMGKLPYTALTDAIFAHPTFAEALNILFAKIESNG